MKSDICPRQIVLLSPPEVQQLLSTKATLTHSLIHERLRKLAVEMTCSMTTVTCLEQKQKKILKQGKSRCCSPGSPTSPSIPFASTSSSTSVYYLLVLLLAVFALPVYKHYQQQHQLAQAPVRFSSLPLSTEHVQGPSQPLAPTLVHEAASWTVTTEPLAAKSDHAMDFAPAPAKCPFGGWIDEDGNHWSCHIYYSHLGLYHFTRYTVDGLDQCPPGTAPIHFFFGQRTACASSSVKTSQLERSCTTEERHHWEYVICHPSREACLAPRALGSG